MKLPIINTLLLIAILGYLVIIGTSTSNQGKEGYVVTADLFADFNYSKELDSEFLQQKDVKEKKISVLRNELMTIESELNLGEYSEDFYLSYQTKLHQFQQFQIQVERELIETNDIYNGKIWDKLNGYVSQYGSENNYETIFGANGNGNIMYAKEKSNITLELTEYCNKKYSGR